MNNTADPDDWWKGEGKPGKRHRKRRAYRARKVLSCRKLIVGDSYGNPRIILGCKEGKQPTITLLDREGNGKLFISLERRSIEAGNGEGSVTRELPYILLHDGRQKIRIELLGGASIELTDDTGKSVFDTVSEEKIEAALNKEQT